MSRKSLCSTTVLRTLPLFLVRPQGTALHDHESQEAFAQLLCDKSRLLEGGEVVARL